MMRLLSVNVSTPIQLQYAGRVIGTGIFKKPVSGAVRLASHNLDGDRQADYRVHGGPDKAVYAYPHEHYAYWAEELGRDDFEFGQFGENFTVERMLEDTVCIGDVYGVGDALLQVTQPRAPCYKLGMKMGLPEFPKIFLASGRSGFYLRVLREGTVEAGQAVVPLERDPHGFTVREVQALAFSGAPGPDRLKAALALPALSKEWRKLLREA
jgi:MOSC domain-containing protein YiiM